MSESVVEVEREVEIAPKTKESSFSIPIGVKIGLVALVIIAVIVVVAIVMLKKEQQKSFNANHTIETLESYRNQDQDKIEELTSINNDLNNKLNALLEERAMQQKMIEEQNTTQPVFKLSEEPRDNNEKPLTTKQRIQKMVNQQRQTVADMQMSTEEVQDTLDIDVKQQLKQMTHQETKAMPTPKVEIIDNNNNVEDNDDIENNTENDETEEDLPISTFDKNNIA